MRLPSNLPGVKATLAPGPALLLLILALALVALAAGLHPPPAVAQGTQEPQAGSTARTPLPSNAPEQPSDFEISAEAALRLADGDPNVEAAREAAGGSLTAGLDVEPGRWEVGYFAANEKVVLVEVDGVSGEIRNSFTGSAVIWPMARGRSAQFGHVLNSPWVWFPMAAVFFFALLDWRRPIRIVHLDLLVLLSFGVSHAFFNAAEIGVSVPLYYPPLLYLLTRMLWIGFRSRPVSAAAGEQPAPAPRSPTGLNPTAPMKVLIALCIVLAVFRVTINVADSGVIDVGYAGVVGADQITDAEPIYGEGVFPADNPTGDTYGPANYFAYVPFEQIFPWSGAWDDLLAARAAALFFDFTCLFGLIVLGRRLGGRGRRSAGGEPGDPDPAGRFSRLAEPRNHLAVTLALAWLAYPYTSFVLQSNSNDSLLAALLIWSLVLFAQPLARGALLGLAAMTKFAPLVLAPLYLAGERGLLGLRTRRRDLRPILLYSGAFIAACALMLAHPTIDPGLATFWDRTIGSQAGRESPFSIWGQADLETLHTLSKLAAAGLALAVALLPRRRDFGRLAALGASVMIAVELTAEHWFYLYIVWFLPLLLVALAWNPGTDRSPSPSRT